MRRGPHTDLTTLINDLSVEQFGTEFAGVWSDIIMHSIEKINEWGLIFMSVLHLYFKTVPFLFILLITKLINLGEF